MNGALLTMSRAAAAALAFPGVHDQTAPYVHVHELWIAYCILGFCLSVRLMCRHVDALGSA